MYYFHTACYYFFHFPFRFVGNILHECLISTTLGTYTAYLIPIDYITNNISRRVQIIQLFIIQIYLFSSNVLCLKSEYTHHCSETRAVYVLHSGLLLLYNGPVYEIGPISCYVLEGCTRVNEEVQFVVRLEI